MSGMSISGGISTAAAALLASLSEAPLALDLLLRVRVVRSRDISVFSLGRTPRRALSPNPFRGAFAPSSTVCVAPFRSSNCG
jgi:hypothetical protein